MTVIRNILVMLSFYCFIVLIAMSIHNHNTFTTSNTVLLSSILVQLNIFFLYSFISLLLLVLCSITISYKLFL